ncbi:uncharacterized protein BXZ73DRAFT_57146 [Epithele typhae]|uniref:uncharacterized protein n=1 Tax=Epithele typhae TaxID=378194 RepID=UPI0020082B56|nr:uncharacterized protein BXZ73DRAFT_57146 [Epithele typhae]KAH9911366.1 hypothetical protein BXZ73DRAFT_57146 [Epithele typhae]
MPTGLGRRASELEEREDIAGESFSIDPLIRRRSVSMPAAAEAARWRAHNGPVKPVASIPVVARISPDLLSFVFSYASDPDLLSLARTSKAFSTAALQALYKTLDLRNTDDEHVEKCITLLARRRPLAALVRSFACRELPPPDAGPTSLNTVTFAIALTNMDHLHTLALPHFDLRLLCHATFSLRHLTIQCRTITPDDFTALFSWIARHPALHSLSFPALVLPALPPAFQLPSRTPSPDTSPVSDTLPSDPSDAPDAPSPASPFPANVAPALRRLHAPVSICAALAPGRPLTHVTLPIQQTLYDGLRPSALMSALAAARGTLRGLAIAPASAKLDGRTLERVVMSAGAELGEFVEELEVRWMLDDEALYRLIQSVLARFRVLRTLRLFRDSPPPHPPSPLLEFPLPPITPPISPNPHAPPNPGRVSTSTSTSSTSAFLRPPGASASAAAGSPFPRVHERAHLALWCRARPTLRTVLFLSGAEWGVFLDPTVGGEPQFEFVGYAPCA